MAANIRIYEDEACLNETYFEKSSYHIDLGPVNGLNGDDGISYDRVLYLKNIGDATAKDIVITEYGDTKSYFRVSTDSEKSALTRASINDLRPGEVTKLILHSVIPSGTKPEEDYLQYIISFWTSPRAPIDQSLTLYTLEELIEYYTGNTKGKNVIAHLYGYGPYGNPLYGQEGLIHEHKIIDGDLPIAGMAYTYIYAQYSIVCRYNGTEDNIEDIQACYTDRYMRLGCYDGPALPLWTVQTNEQNLT